MHETFYCSRDSDSDIWMPFRYDRARKGKRDRRQSVVLWTRRGAGRNAETGVIVVLVDDYIHISVPLTPIKYDEPLDHLSTADNNFINYASYIVLQWRDPADLVKKFGYEKWYEH